MELPNVIDFISDPEVALLIIILMTNTLAFLKGWIVPKAIYDREVSRGDKAVDALAAFAKTVDGLTDELRARQRIRDE